MVAVSPILSFPAPSALLLLTHSNALSLSLCSLILRDSLTFWFDLIHVDFLLDDYLLKEPCCRRELSEAPSCSHRHA
jgi:hypothetical protein